MVLKIPSTCWKYICINSTSTSSLNSGFVHPAAYSTLYLDINKHFKLKYPKLRTWFANPCSPSSLFRLRATPTPCLLWPETWVILNFSFLPLTQSIRKTCWTCHQNSPRMWPLFTTPTDITLQATIISLLHFPIAVFTSLCTMVLAFSVYSQSSQSEVWKV